jgi:hypothetical protein
MKGHLGSAIIAVVLASCRIASAGTLRVPFEYPTIKREWTLPRSGGHVLVAPGFYADNEVRNYRRACVF